MEREFKAADVAAAARRVAAALRADDAVLTELDQAVGDGDLGVTAIKLAEALETAADQGGVDLGKFLAQTGMALNRAAPSTMGTLMATALMQAGKKVIGKESLLAADSASAPRCGHGRRPDARQGEPGRQDAARRVAAGLGGLCGGAFGGKVVARRGRGDGRRRPRRDATASPRCATGSAARAGSANARRARSIPVAPLRWSS